MFRHMLKSKIHRATVTQTELQYEGSLTLDSKLMEAADILPNEKVMVYNITNGERFDTYVIKGKAGTGTVCVNGAAARKACKGDLIIIVTYGLYSEDELKNHSAKLVLLASDNSIKLIKESPVDEIDV
ncbi:MAG: aspartate 1-decarboxylase [Thermodesulfobacteria bacterium]|nr:aspartate 1-decarboxylase [Thermodesulfobacteriota bacterium]